MQGELLINWLSNRVAKTKLAIVVRHKNVCDKRNHQPVKTDEIDKLHYVLNLKNVRVANETESIPCVFILLTAKDCNSFIKEALVIKCVLRPNEDEVDFEKAAINGFSHFFPDVMIMGCFFHLGHCLFCLRIFICME